MHTHFLQLSKLPICTLLVQLLTTVAFQTPKAMLIEPLSVSSQSLMLMNMTITLLFTCYGRARNAWWFHILLPLSTVCTLTMVICVCDSMCWSRCAIRTCVHICIQLATDRCCEKNMNTFYAYTSCSLLMSMMLYYECDPTFLEYCMNATNGGHYGLMSCIIIVTASLIGRWYVNGGVPFSYKVACDWGGLHYSSICSSV